MPTRHLAQQYQEVKVRTATPIELVVLLYDAAIEGLQKAQERIAARDIAGRTRSLNRVTAILTELQANLNFEAGGDIAAPLDRLYRYMKNGIFQANLSQNPAPLKEFVKLLSGLRSAWVETLQAEARKCVPAAAEAQAASMSPPLPLAANSPGAASPANLNITA